MSNGQWHKHDRTDARRELRVRAAFLAATRQVTISVFVAALNGRWRVSC